MTKSLLPPSSAARRVNCPGSRELESHYPRDNDSPYAHEGKLAHSVARQMLINPTAVSTGVMQITYPDVTQEMIDGALLYFEAIGGIVKNNDGIKLHIEEAIEIKVIHSECWGTPDCWAVVEDTLHVWDYKFGFRPVEIFENWQLIEYAAGIMELPQCNHVTKIELHIVQPRGFHRDGPVRSMYLTILMLRAYTYKLQRSEAESMLPNAKCNPNPECNFCSARHVCPALQTAALTAVDQSKLNTPHELPPAYVGVELRELKHAAKLLDARITGLEEQAIASIKKGERVLFFTLEQSSGRERWKVDAEEIAVLGELMEAKLTKPIDVVTPKQAIKLGLSADIVRRYSETPRGALKLTEQKENDTRKLFGGN